MRWEVTDPAPPSDVVPALRVAGFVALLGVPLGLLWVLLAPTVTVRVVAAGRGVPLLAESQHRFDALGVFLVLALAVGVLAGAGSWLVRSRRGPALLLGAMLGALLAAALGAALGELLVMLRYGDALLTARVGAVVERPPGLESAWVLVAAPFAVAVTWSAFTAFTGTDDLGRTAP